MALPIMSDKVRVDLEMAASSAKPYSIEELAEFEIDAPETEEEARRHTATLAKLCLEGKLELSEESKRLIAQRRLENKAG